jgi:hypothetical protein
MTTLTVLLQWILASENGIIAPAWTSCSIKTWNKFQSDWPIKICQFELFVYASPCKKMHFLGVGDATTLFCQFFNKADATPRRSEDKNFYNKNSGLNLRITHYVQS